MGQTNAQRELGGLRTYASQMAALGVTNNEEEFYSLVSSVWLRGFVLEVNKIFGTEQAEKLLTLFKERHEAI